MIFLAKTSAPVVALLLVLSACGGSSSSPGVDPGADSEWRFFGHDLHNTRSNTVETAIGRGTVADLTLLWEHTGVETTSTPAVVDGVVYFADWDGRVLARSVADGAEVWTQKVSDTSVSPSLAVTDTRVFVGVASSELTKIKEDYTFRGSVVALAQDTGDERWRVYVTEDDETSGAGVSVWSSAAVDTERKLAFIGTGQTYEPPASPKADAVVAINYETGTLEWFRQFTEDDIYTALMPLPQGPDADIGAVLWEDQAGARAAAGPTISDSTTLHCAWVHLLRR